MSDSAPHVHQHGDHQHDDHQTPQPDADTHGMLVVGQGPVYLSHLPMFGHPHHDVQAILEVHLSGDGEDSQARYVNDRKRSGERIYTLKPDPFVLQHLITHGPGEECLCEFTGELYRGHFERPGAELLSKVTVIVDHVVHFRQFDPEAEAPVILNYILFGTSDERFLAHLITRPPDFDQVVSVTVSGHDFTDDELRRGPILFTPRRANRASDRFGAGEKTSAEMSGDIGQVQLEIGTEFYFEEGELATKFSTRQTEHEKLAGF
jgi:hypothetical protein